MTHLRFTIAWMLRTVMWGVIASIAWMVISCEEFCEESNRTAVVVNFYSSITGAGTTMKNMTIQGVGDTSKLYKKASLSSALLPLNPTTDTTSYIIANDTISIDTITFIYERHDGFVSSECGCVTYAEIQGEPATTRPVSNLKLINPSVTTVSYRQGVINAENIIIYY